MTGIDDLGYELHDYVRDLTQSHTHREQYTAELGGTRYTSHHRSQVPALIDQLAHAIPLTAGADRGSSGFGSKPTASIEAMDTLIRIDLAAARWVRDLGEDDPGDEIDRRTGLAVTGSGTKACIRKIDALARGAQPVTRRELEGDVRRWWTWARIASGWDVPPWKPDNTCPACAQRGTLRVRFSDQAGYCTECRATWDSATVSLLAEHIRLENDDQADTPAVHSA